MAGERKTAYNVIVEKILNFVQVRHRDDSGNYTPSGDAAARPIYVSAAVSSTASSAAQAYGKDAVGADTYATLVTVSGAKTHIEISLEGANPAIVSWNSGTTDHVWIPAGAIVVFDNITIADAATIQGKNGTAGSNYTNLSVTVW